MIGILYESKEWSSYELERAIKMLGVPAKLIDLEEDLDEEDIFSCNMIVNRIFASAVFRGHQKSLDKMPHVIKQLKDRKIPMVNPYEAHFYEISKDCSTRTLATKGFPVPKVYGIFLPSQIMESAKIEYPCIIKPNCGGRTNYTFIVKEKTQLKDFMKDVPKMEFIVQEYIHPTYGFVTRIEVIDHMCKLILKRSVTESGLSAYHLGSKYAAYDDCSHVIQETAIRAMDELCIGAGSMDIVENQRGFFIIDINSVSNVSEDNTEMFSFDLMKETAVYVVKQYKKLYQKIE